MVTKAVCLFICFIVRCRIVTVTPIAYCHYYYYTTADKKTITPVFQIQFDPFILRSVVVFCCTARRSLVPCHISAATTTTVEFTYSINSCVVYRLEL